MSAPVAARRVIRLEGRTFVVMIDDQARPRSIKERKVHQAGRPWECLVDVPYWHKSHRLPGPGRMGRRQSIVRQVLTSAGFNPDELKVKESANAE